MLSPRRYVTPDEDCVEKELAGVVVESGFTCCGSRRGQRRFHGRLTDRAFSRAALQMAEYQNVQVARCVATNGAASAATPS